MNTFRAMLVRFAGLFRRRRREAEMNDELQTHLDELIGRNLAAGMSADEARFAAQRAFGGVEQVKERARDERRSVWGEQVLQDVRYAARQLHKARGVTIVAVLSLAIGIGANTAVFTVVHALLLRSLPVPEPERLVIIEGDGTYARFEQLRSAVTSLSGLFAIGHLSPRQMIEAAVGEGETESVLTQEVSGAFFPVLGERPYIGRAFGVDDDQTAAAHPVVVLSYSYWQRRFGGDPAVLGQTIRLSNVAVGIVGVMPPGFFGVDVGQARSVDLWCPLWLKQQLDDGFEAERLTTYATGSSWLELMGRLRAGVSIEQARAELETVGQRLGPLRPEDRAPRLRMKLGDKGITRLRGQFSQPLSVLWTITGLVLLVACANVGGLLLARGASRQREFAVRLALGAGRRRIVRQLMTESLLLALIGGAVGLLLASWGVDWLSRYMAGSALDLGVDRHVFGFALLVSAISGVSFGVAPALRFSRLELTSAFKRAGAGLTGRQRLHRVLVVIQIAISVTLLAGAGLFVRTLQNLRSHDPGFARENVLQFGLDFGRAQTDSQRAEIYRRVLAEIENLPGVRRATISAGGLIGSSNTLNGFTIDGVEVRIGDGRGVLALSGSRHYFETKGVAILRGRDFNARDDQPGAPRVAVISETIAKTCFPDGDPIGRHIGRNRDELFEIVGVARDAQVRGLREPAEATVYLPYFQNSERWADRVQVSVRSVGVPLSLIPSIRAAVKTIDSRAQLVDAGVVTQLLERRFTRERALAELASAFSVLTLVLCGIGLYGVLAYAVTQRTSEIGVRIALGAQVKDILSLVVGQAVGLAIVGAVLGIAGAAALARVVAGFLYGVEPNDPWAFGTAVAILLGVALIACGLPARRAAKIDPTVALRAE